MKLSIIIPIYNVEKYLRRCLESVLAQTYTDLEILLVNDGSIDNSLAISEEYAKLDERIIIINQENKGPAAARNAGIKKATGTYIGFIDSDDFIEKNMFQNLVEIALKVNIDVVISHFKIFKKGETKYTVSRTKIPTNLLLRKDKIKEYVLTSYYGDLDILIPSLCNKIYKKDFLLKNDLLIDEYRVRAEDYWYNFDVFKKAESVYVIEGAYYHYYNNDNSIMKTFRETQFDTFLKSRKKLVEENKYLECKIDWKQFNTRFIINCNEFILLSIKSKGYLKAFKNVYTNMENIEYKKALQNTAINNSHMKLIKVFVKKELYIFTYLVFVLWSLKARINEN